ncbi:Nose resistant to fluoxetine protein 6 [Camponotus floridanus]|uniref:Nose resistant to fluoxetine protein 6 n=1 Tax=Camponotus floridanus TaxID=104421 RepID=E2ABJ8_CAMFO|nr:Nose resistant to fluoxetine protein 6 [Camponotus floridanus]
MAVALPGKFAVALLALIVLLYATCYGFRIRDIAPQTPHSVCVPTHDRACPDKTTTTGKPVHLARKWHEGITSRTTAADRKPPAESTSDIGTEKIRTTERPRDKDAIRFASKKYKAESVEVDDDEDVEVEEDEESREDFERDRTDRIDEDDVTETELSDRDAKIDDEEEEDDEQEEEKKAKVDRRKVVEPLKKQVDVSHKKQKIQVPQKDEDEDGSKEDDIRETVPSPRKLEKVRLADKDKTIVLSKRDVEKPKHEDKRPTNVTKPAVESVKKTIERTKKLESIESTRKPVESAKKSIEVSEKLSESKRKIESVKVTPEPKTEVPKTATKIADERSKTRVKPGTSTPAPRIKEQAKQAEKVDVKKVTTKATSKPSMEVSQVKKQETKPTPKKRTDASVTLSELNDAILRVPTFVPNFTNVESLECQQHGKIFLRQLRGYKLWALQMLDASAKIPSGLLRGNVNQLGDYDQCLGVLAYVKVDERTIRIQGKYCLATMDLHASHPDMRLPVNLMQGRAFIRASMHDPGHFIPKFTTINWALCLPAACSAKDAERALESALEDYNGTVGIRFTVDVDPNMCYVKQKPQTYSKETIGVLYFYAMVVCLVIVATVRDYFVETQGKGNYSERIIMSFSLRRTVKALFKDGADGADITCVHGIRTLATIALYIAHQLVAIARIPFSNRASLTEIANNPASSILRVSLVYTDAFLLLSGLLTAYNMAEELKIRGEIRWFCRFIARFIRHVLPIRKT